MNRANLNSNTFQTRFKNGNLSIKNDIIVNQREECLYLINWYNK